MNIISKTTYWTAAPGLREFENLVVGSKEEYDILVASKEPSILTKKNRIHDKVV